MKLIKYGLTLQRIREEDIEMVREWRNSDYVREKMEYREYITPEMQKAWFEMIDNPDNFYYIIIYKNEKIGVINEKGFDRYGNQKSESGLFLKSNKYENSIAPVLASLILIEMNFYFLNGKESYIRILKENEKAISYNKSIGYQLCENQEDIDNQLYVMTRETFEEKTKKIRKAALRISGNDPNFYLVWEPHDYESGIAKDSEKIVKNYPIEVKSKWENNCRIFYITTDVNNLSIISSDVEIETPKDYFQESKE
ncbi:MAG: GNAT family N-acetyltransferase [Bacteroidetes bacterium]|jgi:RimJ/RimL family protein N-acetyltransferase|nr:GNAT family N-acetyltransferase [Bacteroidota bacterium]MBT6687240.1 GNAT family N-acetyltransferase [Bacteroidota bacterium]MBT7144013.1 GNAT family N-acetyltransferase [Bacteroidota bacterium]MBT7493172.1 GNAT family N-acetyltransferase [Bacteroidota bacterium]